MITNYLKIAYRNIWKNKGTTLINAFGMALAIGCCMVVYEFINFNFNYDAFHSQRDSIYVVQREMDVNGDKSIWNDVPQGLGPALQKDFPQITEVVRINRRSGVMQYDDKVFNEGIAFVDDGYYTLFDFPVKWGNPATFSDKEGIVLSWSTAEKYFGSVNPVGETLTIRFKEKDQPYEANFIVKGVMDEPPSNGSFYNHILVPFQQQAMFGVVNEDWVRFSNPTFIQVKEEAGIADILASEQKYIDQFNQANSQMNMVRLICQPLNGVIFKSFDFRNNTFDGTLPLGLMLLGLLGFFLILMACFNYLNIALASAVSRLKEISVRKVMGGTRRQIIYQFLFENFLICTAALLLGIGLAHVFFLPWFNNEVIKVPEVLQLTYASDPKIWLFSLAILLLVIIGSAGYPALYISKFQPVAILKKEFKVGSKSRFQKALVGGQLFMTIITVFCMYAGLSLQQSIMDKSWGYNQNDIAIINLKDGKDFKAFKSNIQSHPDIIEIAGSQEVIGRRLQAWEVNHAGESYDVQGLTVAANYFQTLEIPLVTGRFFDELTETDQTESVIINESFRKLLNWEEAIGQRITIDGQSYRIVGETKDIYQRNFVEKIQPLVFKMGSVDHFSKVSIRAHPGKTVSLVKTLKSNWEEFYPNDPYSYHYQDRAFWFYHKIWQQGADILSSAALITFIVSMVGIFGLALLLLSRKMKEISVRKVLGANQLQIAQLIQKDFFMPLVIATVLALPIGHWMMTGLRDLYAPNMPISSTPYLLTVGSVLLMLLLSLGKHMYTAIQTDPSQFLRDE